MMEIDGKITTLYQTIAEEFNNYYVSVADNINNYNTVNNTNGDLNKKSIKLFIFCISTIFNKY
jgi:hypothetical protein